MTTSEEIIHSLGLKAHPEGGYFRQMEKSSNHFLMEGKCKSLYTSIYFLLEKGNPSRFHRLTSDEIWYFHLGQPLTIHLLYPDGIYKKVVLGPDLKKGQCLQFRVPKGIIFGSTVEQDYALVSCMVAPGFEFSDFELLSQDSLLKDYPEQEEIIKRLTLSK